MLSVYLYTTLLFFTGVEGLTLQVLRLEMFVLLFFKVVTGGFSVQELAGHTGIFF